MTTPARHPQYPYPEAEYLYRGSHLLAHRSPRVRLSHPAPLDNTEHTSWATREIVETAKCVLCFDCQFPIPPGKGVQVQRRAGFDGVVHATCALRYGTTPHVF